MKTDRIWHGVRLRQVEASADPDHAPRPVRLPAAWDDAAAAALCALAPGQGRIALPALAQSWIAPLDARAQAAGVTGLAARLGALLLLRQGAPSLDLWQRAPSPVSGPLSGPQSGPPPGFVLNLTAFHDPATGFDTAAFAAAVTTAAEAVRFAAPGAPQAAIAMADLATLLALLGLDYAGQPARDVAACLAAILRAQADAVFAGPQMDLLCTAPAWPAPPARCAVPGLAETAAAARAASMRAPGAIPCTAIVAPGPIDALLGVETGGIAPSFAPAGPGGLTRAARAWLSARGIGVEQALAMALSQEAVFPAARPADHAAMHDAVAGLLHAMPPRPISRPATAPTEARRDPLPARRRGFTQKAAIGGHRVFLRTGEYDDGRLGEIGLSLPRETAAVRGLADSLAAAVSLALQHGVPLDAFVDLFTQHAAGSRFAPSGSVDGDPAVARAASIPDYVFRSLAASYLGRAVTPEAEPEPLPDALPEGAPLLPLDLPRGRRAALRLVG